jgi:hypothetical protein
MHALSQSLKGMAGEISQLFPSHEIEFYLYGSSTALTDSPIDIDTLAVVPDELPAFDFVIAAAPILHRLSVTHGVLFNCFPVSLGEFNNPRSQFTFNAKMHGLKI